LESRHFIRHDKGTLFLAESGRLTLRLVSTSIDIAASPERVWQVLTDFSAHPEWNPFIQSISGQLQAGEKLTVRISPPGGKGMTFRPKVLSAQANEELRWKGRLLLPGVFDGEHFFKLEPTATGTRFYHGEKFTGILVALMGAPSFEQIKRGFTQMNEAIKLRAEASCPR
jgi:hypothetical protein